MNVSRRHSVRARFVPAMDWWLLILICLLLGLLLTILVVVLWSPAVWYLKLTAVLVLLLFVLYIIDTAFFTTYYLTDSALLISNQLRQVTISYRQMRELRPGGWSGLVSFAGRKRFALSANSLLVVSVAKPWPVVSISPKERQKFIDALMKEIDKERSGRASRVAKV